DSVRIPPSLHERIAYTEASPLPLPQRDCVAMPKSHECHSEPKAKNPRSVLSVAKNLSSFTAFRTSLRLRLRMTVKTQSQSGRGQYGIQNSLAHSAGRGR